VNAVDLVMVVYGILWVLVIGISNTLGNNPSTNGDPKVIGFDVATGNVSQEVYYFERVPDVVRGGKCDNAL